MKSYFNFKLVGKLFFPLWLLLYFFVIIPYIFVLVRLKDFQTNSVSINEKLTIAGIIFLMVIAGIILSFYTSKLLIKSVSLGESNIECKYSLSKFIWMFIKGLFLSVITLFIYSPWFIVKYCQFFVDNASYKGSNFKFRGKGGELLLILILTLLIPGIWFSILTYTIFGPGFINESSWYNLIFRICLYIILIPYTYYSYKWMFNFRYKDYIIKWNTSPLNSIGRIAREIGLSIITFGVYYPLALLNLYKYFAERTESINVEGKIIKFGYDIEPINDLLLIWGQILLTIITVGIYFPWAICKINSRILSKTFVEVNIM